MASARQQAIQTALYHKKVPEFLEALVPVLTHRIKAYHELFSLPLIAEQWEETLHRGFGDLGLTTTWKPDRSHAIGEDMRLNDIKDSRISCKSGQFVNDRSLGKQCVKFNGSRSTSYPNLDDKISHFCKSHDDFYFLLAKNRKFDKTYKLLVFESSVCKVNQLEWSESSSGKAWNGTGIFKAAIGKSMSAQLWTTLPLDLIPYSFEIDCRDETDSKIAAAIKNYEQFHEMLPGSATVEIVKESSAGIDGWAQYNHVEHDLKFSNKETAPAQEEKKKRNFKIVTNFQ